jgi:antitoxin component YwqK of YwqJK toxin-antitoxin module
MASPVPHETRHRDGSLWARGQTVDDVPTGYWEWFRKDGTLMRSGHFRKGEQAGEWTTYESAGAVYKVTRMKLAADGDAGSQEMEGSYDPSPDLPDQRGGGRSL